MRYWPLLLCALWLGADGCGLRGSSNSSDSDPSDPSPSESEDRESNSNLPSDSDRDAGSFEPQNNSDPGSEAPPDGVRMIYPTKPGGDTWYMDPSDLMVDSRFEPNFKISQNADGSWKIRDNDTRMDVFTNGNHLSNSDREMMSTYDYSKLAERGYWYQERDWKNVEVTGYIRVNGGPRGQDLSWVVRSVRHSTTLKGCGGAAYHTNINVDDGKSRFKKEMWHVQYDTRPYTKSGVGSIRSKWVGVKGMVYNLPDGNVKMEVWVDKDNDNNWEKTHEYIDQGGWGDDMTRCGAATPDAKITWGSPGIIFKWTLINDVDFQKLSVREIAVP